jgi:hypothetical protein
MKLIQIKLSRCFLVLDEQELLNVIPASLLEKGIKQGKGYLRAARFAERVESLMNGNGLQAVEGTTESTTRDR